MKIKGTIWGRIFDGGSFYLPSLQLTHSGKPVLEEVHKMIGIDLSLVEKDHLPLIEKEVKYGLIFSVDKSKSEEIDLCLNCCAEIPDNHSYKISSKEWIFKPQNDIIWEETWDFNLAEVPTISVRGDVVYSEATKRYFLGGALLYQSTILLEKLRLFIQNPVIQDHLSPLIQNPAILNNLSDLIQNPSILNNLNTLIQNPSILNNLSTLIQNPSILNNLSTLIQNPAIVECNNALIEENDRLKNILQETAASLIDNKRKPSSIVKIANSLKQGIEVR